MEYNRQAIALLKADIKKLSLEQTQLKPQRKTVHFTGVRTVPAWKAVGDHQCNRWELRYLFLAYGLMRGKTILQIEPNAKTPISEERIQKVINKYEQQIICGDAQRSAVG
jgi:hypothetical protein